MHDIGKEMQFLLEILQLFASLTERDLMCHRKLIRDVLDPFEGYLRGRLNSRNKYDHSTLKFNATFMSPEALRLRISCRRKQDFNKLTHREHAKPLAILSKEMRGLSGEELLEYLNDNLRSVTILKEEAKLLDKEYKITMPDTEKLFSRFQAVGIEPVAFSEHDLQFD